jgi:hypothetical protein
MTTNGYLPDRRVRSQRQLIQPPRAADRITLPTDFGTRFTVYVYTQEVFNWQETIVGGGDSVQHVPEFQHIAEAHGVIPTYLLNYQMAMSGAVRDIIAPIAEAGRCVIGAQLHPWSTPPEAADQNPRLSYAGKLAFDVEQAKIETLTRVITTQFGVRPTVYRAGRYGVGPNTAAILTKLGYRMDVSIRPGFDYRHDGGPNFANHDARPFWAGPESMLIAMPMGACFTGSLRQFGRYLYPRAVGSRRIAGALARSGLISRVALTPEDMPLAEVKNAVQLMADDGISCLNFAFHSTSLAPGHSPYVLDSADLNGFYRWWEDMFTFLEHQSIKPIATDAIVAAAWSLRPSR